MNLRKTTFSIGIPAYGRISEYKELLDSILRMNQFPNEVVVCEDFSNERMEINNISQVYKEKFEQNDIIFRYVENEKNIGYDSNIRKLIHLSNFDYTILIGNDDLFLENSLELISDFCEDYPKINVISRAFYRFENDINNPIGTSKILENNTIIDRVLSPKFIFRSCGFVGGLIIKNSWANNLATNEYDKTLYYQIYLAANAYCEAGIGYIAKPVLGGRSGNPPLFGLSQNENDVHIPGSYSPRGRARMWDGVLKIAKDVGLKYNLDLLTDISKELDVRQSFHIFEMYVGAKRETMNELVLELKKINLYRHIVPKFFYSINILFGKKAYYFYYLVRKLMQ